MSDTLRAAWDEMQDHTDGHNWYWLSYGEKCYAFAVVTAFPLKDSDPPPPSGGRLDLHPTQDRLWIAEDGTAMIVDEHIASIEQQNGDVICRFIAMAYANAQRLENDIELRQQLAASKVREAELRTWKESAIAVTPPLQEIARELNIPLGESIHDKILPGVQLLKLQLTALRECVELYADEEQWTVYGACPTDFNEVWVEDQHGYEPAQAALAKVENMKGGE